MTELRVCQHCFKASRDFQVIDENSREMLDVLLLKIDFSLNEDYSMNSLDVDIEGMKEDSGTDTISNSDDAICRLCLKRNRCVDLNILNENFGEDITAKCMPEL
ncbi:hypothetical protein NQ318_014126, partial [Aromia moschata]